MPKTLILACTLLFIFAHTSLLAESLVLPGEYIVVMRGAAKVNPRNPQRFRNRLTKLIAQTEERGRRIKEVDLVLDKHALSRDQVKHVYTDIMVGFAITASTAEIEALMQDPQIEGIYLNEFAPLLASAFQTVSTSTLGSYYVPPSVTHVGGPKIPNSFDRFIWVIDSGIDVTHPDLNVVTNPTFAKNFGDGQSFDDTDGHGTMVAGIAAARYNSTGTTGVAPGAPVVPVRVAGSSFIGDGVSMDTAIAALDHVKRFNLSGDVVNMSFGLSSTELCGNQTSGRGKLLREAMQALGFEGTWVVSGAGNDGQCNGTNNFAPACVNGYHVFSVGAIEPWLGCASYSNWGTPVDWATMGSSVSTLHDGQFGVGSGTSFAAPVLAGLLYNNQQVNVDYSGTVSCCGSNYHVPSFSSLGRATFDVDLELEKIRVSNVRDLDGGEDLFGKLFFNRLVAFREGLYPYHTPGEIEINTTSSNFFSKSKSQATSCSFTNGERFFNVRKNIASGISYFQLLNLQIKVGGTLADEEGIFNPRPFVCNDCNEDDQTTRALSFTRSPSTMASLQSLVNNGTFQVLRFGSDTRFELNFYENGRQNDGWVKVFWRVFVKPRPVV